MSETVDSFNGKIDEIKADREKFNVLMDEFFESKDMNIKELLAEMMFHIIMTRGAELQEKFDEIDKMRDMFKDIDLGQMPSGGYQTWPTFPNTITSPNSTGTWISTDHITLQQDGTFEVEDIFVGNDPYDTNVTGISNTVTTSSTKVELGDFGNVTFTNGANSIPDDEPVIIPSVFTNTSNNVNVFDISDVKIQNIIEKYESVSDKKYSDDSFKSAINAIGSINWNAQTS